MLPPLLFISHRIPYPPDRGDKIRSFHLLKKLSESFNIHLGSFCEENNFEQYIQHLAPYIKTNYIVSRPLRKWNKIKFAVKAISTNQPISFSCFASSRLQNWIDNTVKKYEIKHIFVYCSSMAQYVMSPKYNSTRRVIDFIDVDSEKWLQLANLSKSMMRQVYLREHKLILANEITISQLFNACIFVSEQESLFFNKHYLKIGSTPSKWIENGVDSVFLSSNQIKNAHQLITTNKYIVFTGTMDAPANISAIKWFVQYVWPHITDKQPKLKFIIVGRNPSQELLKMANQSIQFTCEVSDVRPFLKFAALAVAPMLVARGIQNKVLEAMSMSKTVCMTPCAAEGIKLSLTQQNLVTADAKTFAANICMLLENQDKNLKIGRQNRNWIKANYSWNSQLKGLNQLVMGTNVC